MIDMLTHSQAMEDLVSKGLVKAIGISNFTITKTERLIQTAKIVPAVNQVECHVYLQQHKLKEYCDSKGLCIVCVNIRTFNDHDYGILAIKRPVV